MSNRYKGGVLSATPPTTSSSAAPGIWTLEQQMQATAGTGWPFGGPFTYIEDVFSTYLYSGSASTQTITNNINLSGKGGLVWLKIRNDSLNNILFDTARGDFELISNSTAGQANNSRGFVPLSTGFSLNGGENVTNNTPNTYVSWTFREQPKFFDIVTYTGNGVAGREIPHNLGSVPGSIFFKRLQDTTNWRVYHRSLGATKTLKLNTTDAEQVFSDVLNDTSPTSTVFTVGSFGDVNASGGTYVAYLFAHDAGGFGLTGSDNVISCGSYTGSSSNVDINLGYEAQWVLVKNITTAGTNWQMLDIMRGMPLLGSALTLAPNLADADSSNTAPVIIPTATGMTITGGIGGSINSAGSTYIYIAIRRGPMKVPTLGTSVFSPIARTGTGAIAQITGVGFPPDLAINAARTRSASANTQVTDRLRGTRVSVFTNRTDGDLTYTNAITAFGSDGETLGTDATQGAVNVSGSTYINWLFGRAPGFFDEVCYTGTGTSGTAITHNLTVVPELIISKARSTTSNWLVWATALGSQSAGLLLNTTDAVYPSLWAAGSSPTSSNVYINYNVAGNSSVTYVAYLFATCAGVSKVGSYTGTATTKQIDCGFTAGSRFVLIKRTDSTGDWYVWDSARGIVSGNDPYLLLNDTAAEVTGTDYVDTYNAGFELSSTAPAGLNANGGTYIFLAIA